MVKSVLDFFFKDIYIKILAFVLAILIYFNAVMERNVTMTFRIPIIIDNLTETQVISEKTSDNAVLTVQGKGKDFIGLHPERLQFKLDLANAKLGMRRIKLIPEDLGLPTTLSLKSVDPDYVELTIDRLSKRSVEVSIPLKDKPEKGYSLINVVPKTSVALIGPKEDINFISVVSTESLSLANLKETKDLKLKIIPPEGDNFNIEPNSVEVNIQIETESARIFLGIPLEIKGSTSNLISVVPKEAQIAVSGPESKLKVIKPNEINAILNIANLTSGTHQVRATITLPLGISLVKCEPAFFQVKIQ
jgi:YbbR domain-containing protein